MDKEQELIKALVILLGAIEEDKEHFNSGYPEDYCGYYLDHYFNAQGDMTIAVDRAKALIKKCDAISMEEWYEID